MSMGSRHQSASQEPRTVSNSPHRCHEWIERKLQLILIDPGVVSYQYSHVAIFALVSL